MKNWRTNERLITAVCFVVLFIINCWFLGKNGITQHVIEKTFIYSCSYTLLFYFSSPLADKLTDKFNNYFRKIFRKS